MSKVLAKFVEQVPLGRGSAHHALFNILQLFPYGSYHYSRIDGLHPVNGWRETTTISVHRMPYDHTQVNPLIAEIVRISHY
jgi:hypothetical protein